MKRVKELDVLQGPQVSYVWALSALMLCNNNKEHYTWSHANDEREGSQRSCRDFRYSDCQHGLCWNFRVARAPHGHPLHPTSAIQNT
jgi:hypothetical protein